MLTDAEVKKLIDTLLDCRGKLVWLIKQTPTNEEQRMCLKKGGENLLKVNRMLGDFNVRLSN